MKAKRLHNATLLLIFALLFNSFSVTIIGQDNNLPVYHYPYKTYTVKDGLSQSFVKRIYQDKNGFLWLGTPEGINRFDGLLFENHRTNSTYPDDTITDIREDNEGNIWVTGYMSMYKYVAEADSFVRMSQYFPDSLKSKNLRILAFDKKNNFWFGSSYGDILFYFLNDQKKCILPEIKTGINRNYSLSQLKLMSESDILIRLAGKSNLHKVIWLGAGQKEEVIFEGRAKTLFIEKIKENAYVFIDNMIYSFVNGRLVLEKTTPGYIKKFAVEDDELYITMNDTLYSFKSANEGLKKVHDLPIEQSSIESEETTIVDITERRLLKFGVNKWQDYGINFSFIQNMFRDNEQRRWVGTEEGLVKIENEAIQIFPSERGMLRNPWKIAEDNNGVHWVTSFGNGILKINNDLKYEIIHGYKDLLPEKINPSIKYNIGVAKASNGDLLFLNVHNIITYNEMDGFSELRHSQNNNRIAIQDIKEFNGTYYCAIRGLLVIHPDSSKVFYSNDEGLDMTRLYTIEALEKDRNDVWWLASHFGLAKFDGKQFKNYYVDKDLSAGINCVFKDHKENLWFGSHKGLLMYDYTSELPGAVWKNHITESIKFITSIDSSYLVLGMLDKLVLLDLQSHYDGVLNYYEWDEENGFEGQDCAINSGYIDSKENIWFTTKTNVSKLIPDELKLQNRPTSLLYKSITYKLPQDTLYQKIRLGKEANKAVSLESTHSFQVNFYTINYTNPKKIRYQYMLEGYENDWSPPSPQRYANYSNIPVGNYKLKVKTVLFNKESEINELPLKILPGQWHQAKWVLPTGIFLFLSITSTSFYLIYRVRKERKKTQKELLLKELKELKTRHKLLLNQTNPHFTFNILNHITVLVKKGELLDIRRYIGMFGELFRPMLRNDGKLMWTLKEEMEFVDSYLQLEKLRFPDKFEYTIAMNNYVNTFTLIPKMIVQSFINNAIKHGIEPKRSKDGKIDVSISHKGDFLYILIEDNGIGFSQKSQNPDHSKGSGIRTLRNTLDWLNEHYSVQSSVRVEDLKDLAGDGTGTKVVLELFVGYGDL